MVGTRTVAFAKFKDRDNLVVGFCSKSSEKRTLQVLV